MAISTITLLDTFNTWLVRTNQLITAQNALEASNVVLSFGVANSALVQANAARTHANGAYGAANAAFANANATQTFAVSIANSSNAGFSAANLAFATANAAYGAANTASQSSVPAFSAANAAFAKANTVGDTATAAFVKANSAGDAASAAFANSNTNFGVITAAFATANSANATTGVVAATYGGSSTIPVMTVDARGKVTSVSNVSLSAASAYQNSVIITSTSNWVVPTGVTEVFAMVIGGGGGGGGDSGSNDINATGGSDGAQGGVAAGTLTVTPAATIQVIIGAGGAASNTTSGSNGGTSNFATFTATGGQGGIGGITTAEPNTGYGANTIVNSSIFTVQTLAGAASLFGTFTGSARGNLANLIINKLYTVPRNGNTAAGSAAAKTFSLTGQYFPGASGHGEDASATNTSGPSNATGGYSGAVYIAWS